MKVIVKHLLTVLLLGSTTYITAQNHLDAEMIFGNNQSEGELAGYHDGMNNNGNYIQVKVFDQNFNRPLNNCKITMTLQNSQNNNSFTVLKPFTNISAGLYKLNLDAVTSGGTLSFLGKIRGRITISKPGYLTLTKSFYVKNTDETTDYNQPPDGFLFGHSHDDYLSGDFSGKTKYNGEEYYSIDLYNTHNSNLNGSFLLPFSKSTGKVPENWNEFQKITSAVTITYNLHLSGDKINEWIILLDKLHKELKYQNFSSEAIEFLVPVLNALVTQGATTGVASNRVITNQVAEYLLSEAIMPNERLHDFVYRLAQENIISAREDFNKVLDFIRNNNQRKYISPDEAYYVYMRFKSALIRTTLATEITNKIILSKNVWEKLLEEQLKTIAGSTIPHYDKVISLTNFFLEDVPNIKSTLDNSTTKLNAFFYQEYERCWESSDYVKSIYNTFKNFKVKGKNNTGPKTSFTTDPGSSSGTFTDPRDGQVYKYVKIGNQTWMAENLNYKNGNSCCYDNDPSKCATYGRLYDWPTAMDACPPGWHLPSKYEWDILVNYIGGHSVAGSKMKKTGDKHWSEHNVNVVNSCGFNALPSGFSDMDCKFFIGFGRNRNGSWWSSIKDNNSIAWGYQIFNHDSFIQMSGFLILDTRLSVRCIKN